MPKIYRGIDIAGDKGKTGFVDLVEQDDGGLSAKCDKVDLTGRDGLEKLFRLDVGDELAAAAIDQPLGFPARTIRLLAWPEKVSELPTYDPERGRFREADIAMRKELNGLNHNYVRPPVVCDNIWRAVYLIHAAGVTSGSRGKGNCPGSRPTRGCACWGCSATRRRPSPSWPNTR